jgi:hypothetical protein
MAIRSCQRLPRALFDALRGRELPPILGPLI